MVDAPDEVQASAAMTALTSGGAGLLAQDRRSANPWATFCVSAGRIFSVGAGIEDSRSAEVVGVTVRDCDCGPGFADTDRHMWETTLRRRPSERTGAAMGASSARSSGAS